MNGILLIDKPSGWTSHDVINFIRRRFKIKKAGHAGTLDPMATGLLVVLLGAFTKQAGVFLNHDKEYEAVLRLGVTTDTQDATGKTIQARRVNSFSAGTIKDTLSRFTGEIEQIPPMVSAISRKGVKLYKLARKGITVERSPRKIFIENLEFLSFDPPDISLRIKCSKGTYIRTLCHDIGEALGCGGHMSYLRRTRCGDFKIEDAVTIETLKRFRDESAKPPRQGIASSPAMQTQGSSQ